ncbi:MAG: rod shape-determining protein MreC [Gammaproteobacteria bacterium]
MAAFRSTIANRLFLRAPSVAAKSVLLVTAAIVLMVLDRQGSHLDRLRETLSVLVYPVQAAVDIPYQIGSWLGDNLATRRQLVDENRQLKREQLKTLATLQRMATLESENARLRELLESSRNLQSRILVGELLSVDLDPFRHTVVVNKGTRDGIRNGQPIIDAYGVVGQVNHAGLFTSQAILVSDPNHAIPVEVNRNGLRTIALGTGNIDRLELPYVPNSADIQEGDLLVTSGLGMRFPRGYPVGVVTQIKRDPGQAFASIRATPSAALSRSREVLLLLTDDVRELVNKEETP